MPLSPHEQEVLESIETGLQAEDPGFPARLSFGTENSYQRRQTLFAHGCLWLGMVLTLIGFGLIHQALAAGVLVIVYGAGILVLTLIRLLLLRPSTSEGRPPRP